MDLTHKEIVYHTIGEVELFLHLLDTRDRARRALKKSLRTLDVCI